MPKIKSSATGFHRKRSPSNKRTHTILERLLEKTSFTASDQPSGMAIAISIDAAYVRERVGALIQNDDLSRFIL